MRTVFAIFILAALVAIPQRALAFATTIAIASPGREFSKELAIVDYAWPQGFLELVNDKRRTVGWWHVFSECPNDVMHFAYAVNWARDLPQIIEQFTAIKAQGLRVMLVPAAAGAPGVKSDQPVAAVLATGSQALMDKWYRHLREEIDEKGRKTRVWGQHRYTSVPKAMAPTLWIYVEHPHIDVSKLEFPVEVNVIAEVPKEEAAKRDGDDKTLKAIEQVVAAHATKQRKAAEDAKKSDAPPLRPRS